MSKKEYFAYGSNLNFEQFSSGEILSIKNAPFQINSFIFLTVYLKGSIPKKDIFVTLVAAG